MAPRPVASTRLPYGFPTQSCKSAAAVKFAKGGGFGEQNTTQRAYLDLEVAVPIAVRLSWLDVNRFHAVKAFIDDDQITSLDATAGCTDGSGSSVQYHGDHANLQRGPSHNATRELNETRSNSY